MRNKYMPRALDFDGVVTTGLYPRKGDIVITGRTFEESDIVYDFFIDHDIHPVAVYFNPVPLGTYENWSVPSHVASGLHKVNILKSLNFEIEAFYEDCPIQLALIQQMTDVKVVLVGEGKIPSE